ncbi:unnamed protein product, partial [Ectocarpus sp. 12 AP-2014]
LSALLPRGGITRHIPIDAHGGRMGGRSFARAGRERSCIRTSRTAPTKLCVLVAPAAGFNNNGIPRARIARRRCAAAVGKTWCWLLLVLLVLSESPLLRSCVAAAAGKTYYTVLGVEPGVSDENLK